MTDLLRLVLFVLLGVICMAVALSTIAQLALD